MKNRIGQINLNPALARLTSKAIQVAAGLMITTSMAVAQGQKDNKWVNTAIPMDHKSSTEVRATYNSFTDKQPAAKPSHSGTSNSAGATTSPLIWKKIRSGFELDHSLHPRVEKQLNWLLKNKEYLRRALNASTPYIQYVLTEVVKRNLPTELALLPIVESGYRPFASSPTGASGLWQFMPATAKEYGLKQNWWYDGRRDILSSTETALDYLEILTAKYDGDWLLGLAAYNAGAAKVFRTMRKNRKQNKPTDYWSLPLPRETNRYIPRLIAISRIVSDPEKYGITLKAIPDTPYFETVNIADQIDLGIAAKLADVKIDYLHALNPGFKRWATDPDGPHRLNIPAGKAHAFRVQLAQLDPQKRLRWKRYKIKSGDSLGVIAQKFDSSITAIKRANKLKSDRIIKGRHLLIPLSQGALDYAGRRSQHFTKTHIVKSGESLWHIARKYNVGYLQLAKWNRLKLSSVLKPGQRIRVKSL